MRSPLLSPPATFFPSRLTNNWKLCQTKQRSANHKLQNESRNERIFSLHILNWRTIQIIWCYWLTMVPSMAGNDKYFTCKSWNGSARAPVQSISLQFCVVVNMAEMAFIGMNAIARFDSAQFGQAIMVGNFVRLWSMCAAPYLLDFTGIALQVEMGPDRRRGVERTHTRNKKIKIKRKKKKTSEMSRKKSTEINGSCVLCVLIKWTLAVIAMCCPVWSLQLTVIVDAVWPRHHLRCDANAQRQQPNETRGHFVEIYAQDGG